MSTETQAVLSILEAIATFVMLLVMLRELRRNHSVLLRVVDVGTSIGGMSIYENGGRNFNEFKIVLRNLGLSLHRIAVALEFDDPVCGSHFRLALRQRNRSKDEGAEFARGMSGAFSLKSYELDEADIHMLERLTNP